MAENKGSFKTNFGFLMATVGSAIGLGNIWGFPTKMSEGGGLFFLMVYLVLAVVVGYPLMISEIAIGRKSRKAAIETFHDVHPKLKFNGVIMTITPFLLLCFYAVLGGIAIKYMISNLGDLTGAGFGFNEADTAHYFNESISSIPVLVVYTIIFLFLTGYSVMKGVQKGIERICAFAMPALFVMLVLLVIRSTTLPGALEGARFMFTPNPSVFQGTGWVKVFAQAGSQLFLSLSLGMGCIITYGSYMDRHANIEKDAVIIPFMDTLSAVLAGLVVFPALFTIGGTAAEGPGLLFVSVQSVFEPMKSTGALFGVIFFALVFIAAYSSAIAALEGMVSALMDAFIKRGLGPHRRMVTSLVLLFTFAGAMLVAVDRFGGNSAMARPFGLSSWLDFFDIGAEGILMPLAGMITAIALGWINRGYMDDEILKGSRYRSRWFVNLSLRYIVPFVMFFVIVVQMILFMFPGSL